MADVLKKFGRYFLLDQIAQGGMAEIYRARLAAVDGAGRLLVIKRIMAGFGANAEFLQMFKSEIKVTMGFNHPNIVQLYDYGEEQSQPFIAMEFVDGKNLRQVMNRFAELKKPFPVELAVHIIEQAACGLHYAHSFKDKISGEPLDIVHRDISPQNILISYEGGVKVIDFGIAKATTNSESTRAGVIKGKPSYLSPEQITGEALDGRCDIFALGIVLWELLVGRKLFSGDNDLAVLKMIESSQTHVKPPSTFSNAVSPELDAIVMKTLHKSRDKRYQTAEELQRALHKFLYGYMPEFNPSDLSYYARDMFKDEIVADRKKIQKLNHEVEKLLLASELVIHQMHQSATIFDPNDLTEPGAPTDHTMTLVDPKPLKPSPSGAREVWEEKKTKTALADFDNSEVKLALPPKHRAPLALNQPVEVGARSNGTRSYREKPRPGYGKLFFGTAAALALAALYGPDFLASRKGRELASEDTSRSVVAPVRSVVDVFNGKSVQLRLNLSPYRNPASILLNGKSINPSNPVVSVPLDAPLELQISDPFYKTVRDEFVLASSQVGNRKEWSIDVQLERLPTGFLTIKTGFHAEAYITKSNGDLWKKLDTPFEKIEIPADSYSIRLVHSALGFERPLHVDIHPGEYKHPCDNEVDKELKFKTESGHEKDCSG